VNEKNIPQPDPDILQEAARWFVLLASGDASPADRERWLAWRAADARHEAGWQRAQAVTALFGGIPEGQTQLTVDALQRKSTISRGRRRMLGALGGLFAVGIVGWQGWRRTDWSADHYTSVGEQREIVLADGSLVQLDTDTVIDVIFSAQHRLIHLRRGRLLIETAHSPSDHPLPPLFVETAEGKVRALGTRFVVRQHTENTEVSVLEARVAIHAADTGDVPVLSAGESVYFNRTGIISQRTNQANDAAWSKGILIANDMQLGDFIAELARYRKTPLACSPAARHLHISGSYPLHNIDQILIALADTLPVRVRFIRDNSPSSGQMIVPAK
jgi:transmembrane sensor